MSCHFQCKKKNQPIQYNQEYEHRKNKFMEK
jgi:hypothetical protein